MAVKRTGQLGFADGLLGPGAGSTALDRLSGLVKWSRLEKLLAPLRDGGPGRAAWPPLVLFKALLLQSLYGLSDRELEEALLDRLSFRRFCGLSADRRRREGGVGGCGLSHPCPPSRAEGARRQGPAGAATQQAPPRLAAKAEALQPPHRPAQGGGGNHLRHLEEPHAADPHSLSRPRQGDGPASPCRHRLQHAAMGGDRTIAASAFRQNRAEHPQKDPHDPVDNDRTPTSPARADKNTFAQQAPRGRGLG